jgi:hypothetical protein
MFTFTGIPSANSEARITNHELGYDGMTESHYRSRLNARLALTFNSRSGTTNAGRIGVSQSYLTAVMATWKNCRECLKST